MNHRVNFFVKCAVEWGHHNKDFNIRYEGGKKANKKKVHYSTQFFPKGHKFHRPLQGYAGSKLQTLMSDLSWLDELLTSPTTRVHVHSQPVFLRMPQTHSKLKYAKEGMEQLRWLLRVINKTNPTEDERKAFKQRALDHGHFMRLHFPEYLFKPYDHWLICHMWEFLQFYRSTGRLSSIVAEAANAVWKYISTRHESGRGSDHSKSNLDKVQNMTDMEVLSSVNYHF